MFGIGGFELFLILLFGFLIFGPDKLPQLAKTLGSAIQKFRSAQDEVNKVVKTEIYDPLSENPVKNPMDAIDKDNKQKVENKESFAARKAKYDKEREDKRKREAANAAAKETRAAVKEEAAAAREAAKAAGEAAPAAEPAVAAAPAAAAAGKAISFANISAADLAAARSASPSATQVHERVMAARKQASEQAAAEVQAECQANKDLADEILGAKMPVVKKTAAPAEKEDN